jgi:hypothetical protein
MEKVLYRGLSSNRAETYAKAEILSSYSFYSSRIFLIHTCGRGRKISRFLPVPFNNVANCGLTQVKFSGNLAVRIAKLNHP